MRTKSTTPGPRSRSGAHEMPAVKTTIVGGRPPGCGKLLGVIPRGIEVLLKKSAVDPEFRVLLMNERSRAAATIGLHLNPSESEILNGVERQQLEAVIATTRVAPGIRPAFLGRVAAVMLVALGASTTGCGRRAAPEPADAVSPTEQSSVTTPVATPPSDAAYYPMAGVAVQVEPAPPPLEAPAEVRAVDGIRMERPPTEVRAARGIRIDRPPQEVQAVLGARIDRPPAPEDK